MFLSIDFFLITSFSLSTALECADPFYLLPGVGCIYVPTDKSTFALAKTSCPPGSALASPPNDETYWILVDHIIADYGMNVDTLQIVVPFYLV